MIKWLLRDKPALLGDILEERASGRSRAWYWRQIVVAFVRSIGSSVRQHPVLMLRSLGAAVVSFTLVATAVAVAESYLYGYLGWIWMEPTSLFIAIPVAVIPAFFAGWLVPRTHRACAEAAILVMMFSLAVLSSNNGQFRAAATVSLLAGAFVALRQDAGEKKSERA